MCCLTPTQSWGFLRDKTQCTHEANIPSSEGRLKVYRLESAIANSAENTTNTENTSQFYLSLLYELIIVVAVRIPLSIPRNKQKATYVLYIYTPQEHFLSGSIKDKSNRLHRQNSVVKKIGDFVDRHS